MTLYFFDAKYSKQKMIWLSSYPRSGNTLLRIILYQCFGLRSASIYPDDLGNNKSLEDYVGHIEHSCDGKIYFPVDSLALVKTHALSQDDNPAIYIVRNGRHTCVSMYHFYKKSISFDTIISGKTIFGTWTGHLESWHPWNRPDTLLLKYEDLVENLESSLHKLKKFLNKEILTYKIPPRDKIAQIGGISVRNENAERKLPIEYLTMFNEVNGQMMKKLGYYS